MMMTGVQMDLHVVQLGNTVAEENFIPLILSTLDLKINLTTHS